MIIGFVLDIDMTRTPTFALVSASGSISSEEEVDTFLGAVDFVPEDEDLVIDLTDVHRLASASASRLGVVLRKRATWSQTAVVASTRSVAAQLSRGQVDRVASIVGDLAGARDGLRRRAAFAGIEGSS